jgi:hypothetical protein
VAALPSFPGEVFAVYRAKHRPMLVLGTGGALVSEAILKVMSGWRVHPFLQAAPYFGVEQSEKRAGWHPEAVARIRHAEYPQYFYEQLPMGSEKESILRLDQLQPIGLHQDSYLLTEWELVPSAVEILDEWLMWLQRGTLDPEGGLAMLRQGLPSFGG